MLKNKIALITTTKNRPDLLIECAFSVATQSVLPSQWIIVIDDDINNYLDSIKIINKICPFVEFYEFNKGRNKALQFGHDKVLVSHVGWLDDDDLLCRDAIKIMSNYLDNDLIYSDFWLVYENKCMKLSPRNRVKYSYEKILTFNCVFHFTIYSINLFNLCGGINPDYDFAIDYELRLRQLDFADPVKVNVPLYYYRLHNKRMSSQKESQRANALKASNEAIKRRGLSGEIFYDGQQFCRRY